MKKLQHVKQKLQEWNKNTFGRFKEKKDSIWNEVEIIDMKTKVDRVVDPQLKSRKDLLLGDLESVL